MTTYRYPGLPAVDPTTNQIVRNQTGQLFDVADVNRVTPLAFRSISGVGMSTLAIGPLGITDQFEIDDYPKVLWKSGPYEITLWSPDSLVDAAEAAAADAQLAREGVDAIKATKADLVDGRVPLSQLPTLTSSGSGGTPIIDGTLSARPIPVDQPAFIRADVEPAWMTTSDVRIGS